jgi:hypothetical protein
MGGPLGIGVACLGGRVLSVPLHRQLIGMQYKIREAMQRYGERPRDFLTSLIDQLHELLPLQLLEPA